MLILSERDARALVGVRDAIEAVEQTFVAMAREQARNYPVVREVLGYQDAVFGVKTGADTSTLLSGRDSARVASALAAPVLSIAARAGCGNIWPRRPG